MLWGRNAFVALVVLELFIVGLLSLPADSVIGFVSA
jgi:hypothetical protein